MDNKISAPRISKTKRFLLMFLICLTIFQQMPLIKEIYYSQIRYLLYFMFLIFAMFSAPKLSELRKNRLVKFFIIAIIYSLFTFLISQITNVNNDYNVLELFVPMGLLLCSYNTRFDKNQINKLILLYSSLAALLGVLTILYYGNGFVITEIYSIPGKNQIGPILGLAAILMGISFFENFFISHNRTWIINLSLFILLFSVIVIFRNRASIVAIILCFSIYLVKGLEFRLTLRNILASIVLVSILFILVINGLFGELIKTVWTSLTLNFSIYDLNSISAYRTDVYIEAFKFALEHPFFGEFGGAQFNFGIPHNYVLNKWVQFGVFGSMPFIALYFYLCVLTAKVNRKKNPKVSNLVFWLMLFSIIVSLFEYTYPFGPGVSQIILWILVGQYLNNSYSNKLK